MADDWIVSTPMKSMHLQNALMHLHEGAGNTVNFIIQWGKPVKGLLIDL